METSKSQNLIRLQPNPEVAIKESASLIPNVESDARTFRKRNKSYETVDKANDSEEIKKIQVELTNAKQRAEIAEHKETIWKKAQEAELERRITESHLLKNKLNEEQNMRLKLQDLIKQSEVTVKPNLDLQVTPALVVVPPPYKSVIKLSVPTKPKAN